MFSRTPSLAPAPFPVLLLFAALSPASELDLDRIEPFILRRGVSVECVLHGTDTGEPGRCPKIWTGFPANVEQIQPAGEDKLRARITVASSAPSGPSVLRIHSREGISDPVPVWIDDLPEISAASLAPDAVSDAPAPPFVVEAKIEEEAGYAGIFTITEPQILTFQVLMQRPGWEGDPVATLEDGEGNALITVDDGEGYDGDTGFCYRFTSPGTYRILVRDVEYRKDLRFLMRVGTFPLIRCAGPPPAAAATPASVTIIAHDAVHPVALGEPTPESTRHGFLRTLIPLPPEIGAALSPTRIGSKFPQVILREANQRELEVDLPCALSGRFDAKPLKVRFAARAGQHIEARPFSRSLGGSAFPVLDLRTGDGESLASSGRDNPAEEVLRHKIAEDGTFELSLMDLLGGGPEAVFHLLIHSDAAPVALRLPVEAEKAFDRFTALAEGIVSLEFELERFDYEGPVSVRVLDELGRNCAVLDPGFEEKQNRCAVRVALPESAGPGDLIHLEAYAVVETDGQELVAPLDTEKHRRERLGAGRLSPPLAGRIAIAVIDPPILIAELGENTPQPPPPASDSLSSPTFSKDVAPILQRHCVQCHGLRRQRGKYRLDSYSGLTFPGSSGGLPVQAGDPEASELYLRLTAEDPDERMPAEGDPLSEPDIVAIRDWIAAGAVFDGQDPEAPLTSLIPLAPHPAPPESYPAPLPVAALEFSPDGSQLFTGGYHEILVWDTATGTLRRRLPGLPSRILDLSVQPGGERIAAAGGDPGRHGEVRILRLDSGETEKVLSRSSDVLLAARFSPDGSALATGGANNLLEFYSASDWSLRHRWAHHADWVTAIAWNFDGSLLASGSRDRSIKVYNAGDGSRTSNLTGHQKSVVALAFAPHAKRVVSVSLDKTFRQWNLDDDSAVGKPASIDRAPAKLVTSAPAFLIALADGNIALRDPVTGDASGSWSAHTDSIVSIAVHEPSATVAAGSMDGQVALIDLTNGSVRLRFLAAP